jgi:APA family basic amino acid/polyamine antiporter
MTSTTAPLSTARPAGRLLRVLGVSFGLAVTVGNTIGAGILRAPGEIASNVPNTAIFLAIWVAGALYAFLGAVSLAELGAMMPRSGGQYVFARGALGEYPGFIVGWSDWISTSGSVAAVSIVLAESLTALAGPNLPRPAVTASVIIAAFTILLWRGVRVGARAQEITSTLKAAALLALIIACFALDPAVPPVVDPLSTGAGGPGVAAALTLGGVVLALQAVIYTYDGWTGAIYFSEEVRDPGRDIPRSMFGGVASVAAIYLLVNLAFLHVLPLERIAGAPVAAAAVAESLFGVYGDEVVNALIAIALLSTINALLPMAARIIYAMGSDGLFGRSATRVNDGGAPTVALALSAGVAIAFVVMGTIESATGAFEAVIGLLAVFFVANYVLSFAALFVLRRRRPDAPRPYRAWGYPWTTAIALGGSLAFLAATVTADWKTMAYFTAVLAVSYPAYLMMRSRGRE